MAKKARTRDGNGRFYWSRLDVEAVPRLPAFPARWALEDPRGRMYFVFWTREGRLEYSIGMKAEPGHDAVRVFDPAGHQSHMAVHRRPLPRGFGISLAGQRPHPDRGGGPAALPDRRPGGGGGQGVTALRMLRTRGVSSRAPGRSLSA